MTKLDATHGLDYLQGDDLWEGATPGWYWGDIEPDGSFGDTVGPFASRAEAKADFNSTRG